MANTIERIRMLAIFADNKEHSCFEVINTGAILLKKNQKQVEQIFKRDLLEYGWVNRLGKSGLFHTDWYQLTPKGDKAYRQMQIDLMSLSKIDSATYNHYKNFDREKAKKIGSDSNISEEDMRLNGFTPKFGAANENDR